MTARTLMIITLAAVLAGQAFAAAPADSPRVNINTASAQELQLLPRVGPAVATRIVDFRAKNGAFKSAEDLMRVRGIGERTFELLKPYVSVSGATTLKEKVRSPRPKKAADGANAKN